PTRAHFFPMCVNSQHQLQRRIRSETARCFMRSSVNTYVLDSRCRIFGDVLRQCCLLRGIPTRCRNRQWNAVECISRFVEITAADDDFVAHGILHHARRNRIRDGPGPYIIQLVKRTAHADPVNLTTRGQRTYGHGYVVFASLAVDNIGEEECLVISLLNPATELPPDERMHLRILGYRP